MTTNAVPRWWLPITIVALLWNLVGCMAYLMYVRMTPEQIAALTPAQQELLNGRPAWAVAASAIAVWGGALGSLGLILRKRWALPVLIASLLGVLGQDFAMFVLADVTAVYGIVPLVLQCIVLLIAIGLILLARRGIARGWIA